MKGVRQAKYYSATPSHLVVILSEEEAILDYKHKMNVFTNPWHTCQASVLYSKIVQQFYLRMIATG